MEKSDLTKAMQEMMAKMARLQAELNRLKERTQTLPQQARLSGSTITSTRRTTLKRLGLALLGGAAAATAVGIPAVQAKVIANPQTNGMANKAGMLVLPPGAPPPTGNISDNSYGLIATSITTSLRFDLMGLLNRSAVVVISGGGF